MRLFLIPLLFAVGLQVTPAASLAQPADLSRFEAARAQSWASKLVLCDVTAFLQSNPNLDADKILVRRIDSHFDTLLPPYFVRNGGFYSDRFNRLYLRLRYLHRLDSRQVASVQAAEGGELIDIYRRHGPLPARFLRSQAIYCDQFARVNGIVGF